MEEEVKASTWHRNPFGPFKDEILSQIILPKILNLLDDGTVSSKTDLLSKFKETHNATISMTTFDEWLSSLGIKFERVTQVKLPKGMTRPIERQEEMKHFLRFIENYRDGMVQRNTPMMLAKGKKKRKSQKAYEDFVRDSQGMGIGESFKDLRRGVDGEGLDIMKDVLGLDEV